jgi:hypothetical protein
VREQATFALRSWLERTLLLRLLIVETGSVAERLRVSEIDADETDSWCGLGGGAAGRW